MITKGDLKEIARVFHNEKPELHIRTTPSGGHFNPDPSEVAKLGLWKGLVVAMAIMLENNNPRFKRDVFFNDCGVEETNEPNP